VALTSTPRFSAASSFIYNSFGINCDVRRFRFPIEIDYSHFPEVCGFAVLDQAGARLATKLHELTERIVEHIQQSVHQADGVFHHHPTSRLRPDRSVVVRRVQLPNIVL
jgi:hypothetical protein